ncbi:SDR family NAD(P)-dependent oxidoreductase [Roseiflexus castenholzii]|uniref:SDR family NAD(P)-dependent oxidoreductase n=1 Tax=Roseiflexus castenholzii TaxID=120962 RepID=UPI002352AADC
MRGLRDKGVLITGASSGLGKAAARRFLEEGARVFFCGHETQGVKQTVTELAPLGPIAGIVCDVSHAEQVAELVHAAESFLGRIEVLCNNAGIAWEEDFLTTTAEHWDRILAVNLRGMFLVAQAVAQRMVAQGTRGVIINMASKNGLAAEVKYAHYNASKGGVVLLSKTMALELGPLGIRVNALCPGYIQTPLSESIDSPEFVANYIRTYIPLGRVGTPEDIAGVYAFLASDDAAFIHGAEILVDGGQLAQ